eukprot:66703_1
MVDAVSRIINYVFNKDLFPFQPPHFPTWHRFDHQIFEVALYQLTELGCDPIMHVTSLQMLLDVFKSTMCNIMSKAATQHRHEGRYQKAHDLWMHLSDFTKQVQFTAHNFPIHHGNMHVSMCVMYLNWPSMDKKKRGASALKHAHKALECVAIAKELKQNSHPQYKYEVSLRKMECLDLVAAAGAYHQAANASDYLGDLALKQMYYEKAFNAYSSIDINQLGDAHVIPVKTQTHFFMFDYTGWLLRTDPLKKTRLITRLLQTNINLSKALFGELSVETVTNLKQKADYLFYILSDNEDEVAEKWNQALQIALTVEERLEANDKPYLALKLIEDCTIGICKSLAIFCERFGEFCASGLYYCTTLYFVDKLIAHDVTNGELMKERSECNEALIRLQKYEASKEIHRNCKTCYLWNQKHRKTNVRKGIKQYLRKIGKSDDARKRKMRANNDRVLQNTAGFKQCNFCKQRDVKLSTCAHCKAVYYCNHQHQKRDWLKHKKICNKKKKEKDEEGRSFVEMLQKLNS